jgi:hypothetical protein
LWAGAGAGAASGSGDASVGVARRKRKTRLVIAGGKRGNIALCAVVVNLV